jgi:hypothetical protein
LIGTYRRGVQTRIVVKIISNTGNGQTSCYARTRRENVQVNGGSGPVRIDVLRINRDAVRIQKTEGLPIRQAASSRAARVRHTAANAIGKQIVVITDSSTERSQPNGIITRRPRGVAARVVQNVVLVKTRPGGHVAY